MKLCKECQHYRVADSIAALKYGVHQCHRAIPKISLVTGKTVPIIYKAEFERELGQCGPSGKFFKSNK